MLDESKRKCWSAGCWRFLIVALWTAIAVLEFQGTTSGSGRNKLFGAYVPVATLFVAYSGFFRPFKRSEALFLAAITVGPIWCLALAAWGRWFLDACQRMGPDIGSTTLATAMFISGILAVLAGATSDLPPLSSKETKPRSGFWLGISVVGTALLVFGLLPMTSFEIVRDELCDLHARRAIVIPAIMIALCSVAECAFVLAVRRLLRK